jgi:hypothetical protein
MQGFLKYLLSDEKKEKEAIEGRNKVFNFSKYFSNLLVTETDEYP